MSKLNVICSPLTPTIYIGRTNDELTMWIGEKQDITESALGAVADLIAKHGKTIQTKVKGKWYSLELIEVKDD